MTFAHRQLLLPFAFLVVLAFGGVAAGRALANGGSTQNCCNLGNTITSNPSVSVGSTSAEITWGTSVAGDSRVYWGTATPTWAWINNPGGNTVNDVSMVTGQLQWAVDSTGRVLRTTDAWNTFSVLPDPTAAAGLFGIAATSDTTAWVISTEHIYRTTNSGTAWSDVSPAWFDTLNYTFADIVMRDHQEGVAIGNGGVILHTTDGVTWSCIDGPDAACLHSPSRWSGESLFDLAGFFATPTSQDKAYAIGGSNGLLLQSTGSGASFDFTELTNGGTRWSTTAVAGVDMPAADTIWATSTVGGGPKLMVKPSGTTTVTLNVMPSAPEEFIATTATTGYYVDFSHAIRSINASGASYGSVAYTIPFTGSILKSGKSSGTSVMFVGTLGAMIRFAPTYTSAFLLDVCTPPNPCTYQTAHAATLAGLSASTTYHYTVVTTDLTLGTTNWRVTESVDGTFTTVAAGIATAVTKTIGSGPGRDFPTLQAWESARVGNLVTRNRLNVTAPTGTLASGEVVVGQSSGCTGAYVPEDEARTNGAIMTLDGFSGTCTPGERLEGTAASVAGATFQSVASSGGTQETGQAFNDSVFTSGVTLNGSITDAAHFLWLRAAPGQQHAGVAGTGVRIKLAIGATPVHVRDYYVRVWGLDIDSTPNTGYDGAGICFGYTGNYGEAAYNLIHDGDYTGICIADFVRGTKVYNNILYNLNRVGEFGSIQVTAPRNPGGDTQYFYNNTIWNSGQRGIGFGITGGNPLTIDARNNLVLGSTLANFGTQAGVSYGTSDYNVADDSTAPGPNSQIVPPGTQLFHSNTPGSEDLRLYNQPNIGFAMDKATNLTATAGFSDDIVNRNRNDTANFGPAWDTGGAELDQSPPGSVTTSVTGAGWSSGSGYACTVSFTGTTDAQSGVPQYNIYRNGTKIISAPAPTTFGDTGLAASTTYTYEARAVSGDGFERTTGNTSATCTTPTPSFTLGVSKSTVVTTAGGSGDSLTVTVTSQNGFAGTVNLTDTVPVGSGTFSLASLTVLAGGLATSTWTTTTGSGTPAANTTDTITATSGSLVQNRTVTHQNTDFSLGAAAPASASVAPGGSTSFTFPITMTNSSTLFNYSVGSVSVPLIGTISYSFSPSAPYTQNGTATRNQTVTAFTSGAIPPGTYTINTSVSYHGKTVTTPFTLTVAQPDFTFTAPGSLNLDQSTSANLTTTLTSVNGYAGTITYSLVGSPPPGVTLALPPAQNLTAGSTLNPVVVVSASATASSGTVTIQASDGSSIKSVTVSINVVQVQDFTIDVVSSKTVTVAQGTNATYSITVFPTGGFAGPVTQSVTFSPTGPTGTFSPQPLVSGSYTGTLTIPTGAVVPGSYTLTITGSGTPGTRQVTGPVTLTITSNPDFTLVANAPTSQTVAAGATASFNLTVTAYVGYTGTVTLSQVGIPATSPPFTVVFTPSSFQPSVSGTAVILTVATPYDPVGVGTFNIVVTGTDGSKTHTVNLSLTVTADTTPPTITSGPTAIPDFTTATINWGTNEPANGVVEYSTDLSFSGSSSALCSSGSCPTAHSILLSGLTDDTTYNYRVKSTNPFGLTVTSATATFKTILIPDTTAPVIFFVAPANNSTQLGVITITVNATDNKSGVASVVISESGPKNPGGRVLQTLTTGGPNYSITWDTNDPVNGEDNGTVTLTAGATDGAGNVAAPVSIQITLANDKTPPAFVLINGLEVEVTVTLAGSTATATIHWRTDESSTTGIQWGIEQGSGAYTYTNTIDLKDGSGNLVYGTDHLVQLTNLALNSRYHYQVKSCDTSNNCLF